MPDSSSKERKCKSFKGAQESIIHKLAKDILVRRKNMYLFSYSHTFDRYKNEIIKALPVGKFSLKKTHVQFSHIEAEVRRISSDYQPDITAELDNEAFIIEIYYKHPVDANKLAKIKRDDIPAIETSLGHLSNENITPYKIEAAILNPEYPPHCISDDIRYATCR